MKKIFKREFERNDKRRLLLYGYNEHTEAAAKELDITDSPTPHMRWNPFRQEWVTYSGTRKVIIKRTTLIFIFDCCFFGLFKYV